MDLMRPDLFSLDYEAAGSVLALVVIASFMVERALAVIFEWDWYEKFSDMGLKEPIAVGLSFWVCHHYGIDVLAVMLKHPEASWFGELLTAFVIAGGSKVTIKFMQDVLKLPEAKYKQKAKAAAAAAPVKPGQG